MSVRNCLPSKAIDRASDALRRCASQWCETTPPHSTDVEREPVNGPIANWLAAAFAGRVRAEVIAAFAVEAIPVAPVLGVAELFEDAQIAANDLLHTASVPNWGEFRQTGVLVKYTGTPVTIQRAAPERGQHNDDIVRGILGYSTERVAQLRARGVLVD